MTKPKDEVALLDGPLAGEKYTVVGWSLPKEITVSVNVDGEMRFAVYGKLKTPRNHPSKPIPTPAYAFRRWKYEYD